MDDFGLVDNDDARDLFAAAARDPQTRWCVTTLTVNPDGTAAAHGCVLGRHPPPGFATSRSPGGGPSPGPDPPPGPRPQDWLCERNTGSGTVGRFGVHGSSVRPVLPVPMPAWVSAVVGSVSAVCASRGRRGSARASTKRTAATPSSIIRHSRMAAVKPDRASVLKKTVPIAATPIALASC